jgi:hypothetical protein
MNRTGPHDVNSNADSCTAEWKHGAWHLREPAGGSGEADRRRRAGVRTLAEVRSLLHVESDGSRLTLVLPRLVQAQLDEARLHEEAGHTEAAAICRASAARLLRSKRMPDDDIAQCLGVARVELRELLPGLAH